MKKCEDLFDVMAKQHGEECAKAINNRDLMQVRCRHVLLAHKIQSHIKTNAPPPLSTSFTTGHKCTVVPSHRGRPYIKIDIERYR